MANGNLQIIGLLVACAGGLCTVIATLVPDWKKNDPSGSVIEAITRHQGIWIKCVSYSTGQWQCDHYDAFFVGLPTVIQVARGMSIAANAFGFFGFIAAVFGVQCTTCVQDNQLIKSRIALGSAGFWIASGLCIGIAASVFSHDILTEYNRFATIGLSATAGQRFIFGSSLFLGWAAMAISLLGGLVILCGSCGDSHPVTKYQRASVRRVASLGRSVSMSFRRGRPEKRQDPGEYV